MTMRMKAAFLWLLSGALAQQGFNMANMGFGNQPGFGVQMGNAQPQGGFNLGTGSGMQMGSGQQGMDKKRMY